MSQVMAHMRHSTVIENMENLRKIPTPRPTETWTPIPHEALFTMIKREVTAGGLKVEGESLVISQAGKGRFGDRFFGLMDIRAGNGEGALNDVYRLVVGVRNSHDKTVPAGLCVGSRVFVCDNLAFSAEIVISRKHTLNIRRDLPGLVHEAVGRLGGLRDGQARRIAAYQNAGLRDEQFHDMLIRGMDARVICASKLPQVLEAYREPSCPELAPRNVWSGFNAFTQVLKEYDLQDLPKRTQALHGLCDQMSRMSLS